MSRKPLQRPTDAELEILRILWDRGSCTVRDVHAALASTRGAGYTSVLKIMQIMTDKKLVTRDERNKTHVYAAAAPQEKTQRHLVADLLDRAFDGSARALLLQALSAKPATRKELDEIRKMIDDFERGQ